MLVEVKYEYLLYIVIVFTYMLIHEVIHIVVAKYLKLNTSVHVVKVCGIPIGIGLRLNGYENMRSIFEVNGADRVKYILVALAPYSLIPLFVLMIFSNIVVLRTAGIVLLLANLVNMPLEFFQPWSS